MEFKPYKDIKTAVHNFWNDGYLREEVKIKPHNDIYKDERSLIDAAILCKVLKTFYANSNEFRRQYNICFVEHRFWSETTWQMKYKNATCTFEVHYSDKLISCLCKTSIYSCVMDISSYIDVVLFNLSHYAPPDRYKSIKEHIQAICDKE